MRLRDAGPLLLSGQSKTMERVFGSSKNEVDVGIRESRILLQPKGNVTTAPLSIFTAGQERTGMEKEEIALRLETVTTLLEKTLGWLEARQNEGEVERISATIEPSRKEDELTQRLAIAERELADLKASAGSIALNPLRKTVPSGTSEMLAKHGIGEGPVDVRALDAALAGLSLEQRIAVKSQLLRAGAIA